MIELAGSARNKATFATSEGSTRRPIGMASHLALIISAGMGPCGIPANLRSKGVLPDVGQIVLNLSWSLANSRAEDLVTAENPSLVALPRLCGARTGGILARDNDGRTGPVFLHLGYENL